MTESVSSLPKVRFPSKVTFPVACRLPNTSVLLYRLILPVPLGVKSRFSLLRIASITLSFKRIPSVTSSEVVIASVKLDR